MFSLPKLHLKVRQQLETSSSFLLDHKPAIASQKARHVIQIKNEEYEETSR